MTRYDFCVAGHEFGEPASPAPTEESHETVTASASSNPPHADRTLNSLPTHCLKADASTPTVQIKAEFDRSAELPGVLIYDGDRYLCVLSRDVLFRQLSRPFSLELFLHRPVRNFVELWCQDALRLSSGCTIHRATDIALSRPTVLTYEPILVEYDDGALGLLDIHSLLVAQSRVLGEANRAAEAATRAKSQFLANMSHEIRTPITAILGFTDVLLNENGIDAAPPERVDALRTIQRNGHHLLQVINDILDISKVEAGMFTIDHVTCSPAPILAEVIELMRVRAEAKKLPLKLEFAGGVPESIQSDPLRLRQILINLVGNAIKFTETGSVRVVASLAPRGKQTPLLQIDVIDTGIGMSEEQMAALFRPFSQADSSMARKYGGTGLGLVISKRLTEMLGGEISVSSDWGKGSTFRVTIETGGLEGIRLLNNPLTATPKPAPQNIAPVGLDCRILLAEDGLDNQRLIAFLLKKAGARVTLAENGQIAYNEALAACARGEPFDVILMDMQMPVMDGYAATRALRDRGYAGPIIALTAHAMAEDRQKCVDAGCNDYATKPIDRQKLLAVVDHWLAHGRGKGVAEGTQGVYYRNAEESGKPDLHPVDW